MCYFRANLLLNLDVDCLDDIIAASDFMCGLAELNVEISPTTSESVLDAESSQNLKDFVKKSLRSEAFDLIINTPGLCVPSNSPSHSPSTSPTLSPSIFSSGSPSLSRKPSSAPSLPKCKWSIQNYFLYFMHVVQYDSHSLCRQ